MMAGKRIRAGVALCLALLPLLCGRWVAVAHAQASGLPPAVLQVAVGGYWGLQTLDGQWLYAPSFQQMLPYRQGYAVVQRQGREGYIDTQGRLLTPLAFSLATSFQEGLAAVHTDSTSGYVDTTGNWHLPPRYEYAEGFSQGLAAVYEADHWGFIDTRGRWVIAPQYMEVLPFQQGRAAVRTESGWGYIDTLGRWVAPPRYQLALPYAQGIGPVKGGELWGWVDLQGRIVMEPQFVELGRPAEGRVWAMDAFEQVHYYHTDGQRALADTFSAAGDYHQGWAPLRTDTGWVYADTSGQLRIPTEPLEWAAPYADSMAAVQLGGLWGYMDLAGKVAIPPRYLQAEAFEAGYAAVRTQQGWQLINRQGQPALPGHTYSHPPRVYQP
ncbi:MAG: WG repeat-containing protein [Bacteroidetes bacterium]|nr:WG repeat-containing protein [Bacteroidota bacterium]